MDVQEALATALGFQPSDHKLAVEAFLKTYYLHANILFNLCVTVIEAVTHTYQPRLWRFLRRPQREGGFVIIDGYLHHEAPALETYLRAHPVSLIQAFAKAQEHRVPLAPPLTYPESPGSLARQCSRPS